MKPVSGFWLIVALLVCAVSAVAAAGGQPGHLVPVQHETGESAEYRGLIYKNLLVTPAQFGRMIYEPGWYEPEWAVSIYGVGATSRREQPYRSYGITVTKSLSSIWISLPSNNEEHKHKPIRRSRKDATIDSNLAVAVQRAWRTMLSRTRPEEERFIFMDAPTVEFTLGSQRGEITPPRKGLTIEMFKIGTALAKFCDIPAAQRAAEQEKLIRRLAAFERKARKA